MCKHFVCGERDEDDNDEEGCQTCPVQPAMHKLVRHQILVGDEHRANVQKALTDMTKERLLKLRYK